MAARPRHWYYTPRVSSDFRPADGSQTYCFSLPVPEQIPTQPHQSWDYSVRHTCLSQLGGPYPCMRQRPVRCVDYPSNSHRHHQLALRSNLPIPLLDSAVTTSSCLHALPDGDASSAHRMRSWRRCLQSSHLSQSHASRPSSRCAGDPSHMPQVTRSPPPSRRKMKWKMVRRQHTVAVSTFFGTPLPDAESC